MVVYNLETRTLILKGPVSSEDERQSKNKIGPLTK